MTSLQIGLAILGALVLALVVGHGAWSARRSLPRQAMPEPAPGAASPLPAGQRLEPSFDADDGVANGAAEWHSDPRAEDAAAGAAAHAEPDPDILPPARHRFIQPERKAGLDALIDAMAPIAVDTLASGDAALAAMPPTRRAGSKPFGVEGFNSVSGEWEFPVAGQRYRAFQCGVQLVNRTGALNQIEYSEFVIKAQAFADAIGGEPDFPEMLEEVARARELDQFASAHDAQINFTLRANRTAWSPGYVLQSAARLGFVAGVIPGRMLLPAAEPGRPSLLSLAIDTQAAMADAPEQAALRELSLSLDVPQVDRIEQPFARLCEIALALAGSMDGAIIDDDGNLIRAEAMEVIHAGLEQLYDRLEGHDLPAGSVLARRVFS
ncbi:MAG: cell division protein FtsZ [Polaromonas sp.]|nr:cell division protein FtsZ [Polaromonas sp.]